MEVAGGEKEQQGSEFETVFQLEREKVQRERMFRCNEVLKTHGAMRLWLNSRNDPSGFWTGGLDGTPWPNAGKIARIFQT